MFQKSLRIVHVRTVQHFLFNLHEFNFFRRSEGANYLFFGNPRPLAPLVAVPYVLLCEIIFFRGKRFFVKLKERVVGILVVREKTEALYISSLAVAPAHVDAVELGGREDALLDRLAGPRQRGARAHGVEPVAVAGVVAGGDQLEVVMNGGGGEAEEQREVHLDLGVPGAADGSPQGRARPAPY